MPEDGHAPSITPEVGYVFVDPREGGQLVHQSLVPHDSWTAGVWFRIEKTCEGER